MGSIGNYDSELCQSGRSVFEWLWVLVGVGAGEARGAFYLPMVRPSSNRGEAQCVHVHET